MPYILSMCIVDVNDEPLGSVPSNSTTEPVSPVPAASTTESVSGVPSTSTTDSSPESTPWPDCWTAEQYVKFKKDYEWLTVKDGKLGCSTCSKVSSFGLLPKQGTKCNLSSEWVEVLISPYGSTRASKQTSLRKKMYEHKESLSHKAALKTVQDQQSDALKSSLAVQNEKQHDETVKVFRTAYYVAKNDRPYTDHSDLIDLQVCNGISMGRVLHSNVTCTDIIDHISNEMKQTLIDNIVKSRSSISVLIDESTSLGTLTCLNVYVRATFDCNVGPVTFFLDIIELHSTTADGIEAELLKCLTGYDGFTEEFLVQNWIGLAVDGASVMMGSKTGVATRLKAKFPLIVSWHCFNHRLELSVNDAVKSCTEINHFKSFMDMLYAIYSMSPKLQRELSECAKELEVQLMRIGRVLDVRWVASSCRTVKAVWRSYEALFAHFTSKLDSTSLDSRERAKFSGMIKKLQNPIFIQNLGLMFDALEELSDLSLALQKADITLPVANRLIGRQVQVFLARKESDSEFYSEACQAVAAGIFKGVSVAATAGKEKVICKGQFYQALADSMILRMLPAAEKELSNAVHVLDAAAFPAELSPEYGEQELKMLCVKFPREFSLVKMAYREFKESRGTNIQPSLKELLNCVNTIPVSTAECERGFSKMNIVCSNLRSRLTVKHMSALMFVSLSGPPLTLWQPLPYVKSWLLLNRRDANSTSGPSRKVDSVSNLNMDCIWHLL